tara:strand:- start:8669 stop:11494 length:2826 start_codon:yes stop_codon:yes gene_type:complete
MIIERTLAEILPNSRIKTMYIDLVSYASDAGFYHLIPKAVVLPSNEDEVVSLFQFSKKHHIPLVFRAGGTSLSGQAITDGILVDLSQFWNKISVENEGELVRIKPGITGAMVNAHLRRYKRKIGPDPASISAAMMGGILSNNASGMCCGVKHNSYHTVKFIKFILPNGKIFNTEDKSDYARFENECYDLFQILNQLRKQITEDSILFQRIRKKYQTKNTVGYSLNAFVDFEHPLDILAHLLIGAEGTLAFISEAVLETIPDYSYKSTALLFFPTVFEACNAIVPIKESGAEMVELMDRASLYAVEDLEGIPSGVKSLPNTSAALLVEFQSDSHNKLTKSVKNFIEVSSKLKLIETPHFTEVETERALLWKIRKGLFPAVGALRKSGTTVILEDLAFPVEKLGNAILDLQHLFEKYKYHEAIIFGHAKDGNIHFVITQAFNSDADVTRYDEFLREVVALVIDKYDGTLKAEHGTGRNMAPFVETEWGSDIYSIMKQVKQAIDSDALLNPGVIINEDKQVHIKNLKALPQVEEEVDKCIECGFCEHRCPSRNITTTPRRRIVIRRVLKQLQLKGDKKNYNLLLNQFKYEGIDTCAVDGSCATACPVDINTGDLIKRLRQENHSNFSNKTVLFVAKNFITVEFLIRFVLKIGGGINYVFGKKTLSNLTSGIKKVIPAFPLWSKQIMNPPSLSILNKKSVLTNSKVGIVYFPSCISRILGTYEGKQKNVMETFLSVCEKSNIDVTFLEKSKGICCSQIFSSKGFKDASRYTANNSIEELWKASKEGTLNIVIDVSSCAYTLHHIEPLLNQDNKAKFKQLTLLDSVDFLNDIVLPKTVVKIKTKHVVLHPVCSLEKMKTTHKFVAIAEHFAEKVTVPITATCCGMAGDRGFIFPELTTTATEKEAKEVNENKFDGYYSSTKTCEMAMSEAVKENYESILYLVDESI